MARLFISYNRKDSHYAFAIRQWLIDVQGWPAEDIFFDASHLHTGVDWEKKLLAEAEAAEVMLFLASEFSLNINSFCYRELKHATGQVIAVTIGGVSFSDERLDRALPHFAKARQVTQLDQEPTEDFPFISPADNKNGVVPLNRAHVEGIGLTLRELGVAPNSFTWTPVPGGPFPGLRPLMEGDEAIFCGRDLEIRDGLKAIEELRATVTRRALIIQAPSGAGKSSFLRAGLWRRLRRNPGFTPLAIIRTRNGALHHEEWGLIAGLFDTLRPERSDLGKKLSLSRDDIADRAVSDLPGLLKAFADADRGDSGRRTLLIGIDQAEEITALSPEEDAELDRLLTTLLNLPQFEEAIHPDQRDGEKELRRLDLRLVLTARDDSVDATLERLVKAGLPLDQIETWRLNRLPSNRFDDIISRCAEAANRAGWPLAIDQGLGDALATAAGEGGEGGDALPILALALQRLVAKRRAPDGRITLPVAEAKKFLADAVTDATAEALQASGATAEDLRRLVIPRLATWDSRAGSEGAAKRQVAAAGDLFAGDRAGLKRLADQLVAQRLLTRSGTAYEVAHEALLRVPPLGELILACREKFEQSRMLEIEARDWAGEKSTGLLVRSGERLKESFALLQDPDFGTDLRKTGSEVPAYLDTCRSHEARLAKSKRSVRRTVTLVLSIFAVLASVGAVVGFLKSKQATAQRDDARYQEGLGWMLRASVAEERGKRYPDTLLYAAQAIGFDGVGRPDAAMATGWQDRLEAIWADFLGKEETYIRYLDPAVKPDDYQKARDWISNHPSYLPLWSSELQAGAPATAMAVDPSGKWLALGSAAGVRLLDVAGQKEQTIPGITGITDLDFDPAGKTLAIAIKEGVRIWDLDKALLGPLLEGHASSSVAWSPGGDWLAGAAPDGQILLWKNGRGKPEVIKDKLPKAAINLTFSSEDAFLAAIEPGSGPRLFFPEHLAAAASWQGLVRSKAEGLADLEKAEFLSRVDLAEAATCVAIDPKGRFLATGTQDGNVVLWDVEKLTAEARVSPEQRHGDEKANPVRVSAVAFRPDGKQIASAAADGTIKLWEVRSKSVAVVATLTGHSGAVTAVTYAPGGQLLASGGADGSARLWDVRGAPAVNLDLFTYLEEDLYALKPEAAWISGKGFANLAPADFAGRWRDVAARNLVDEAKTAAAEKRWRCVQLLQLQGVSLPLEVTKALANAQLKTEAKLGDSFTNANNMDLLWCPKGTFTMGSSPEVMSKYERRSKDLHEVTFTSGFWLGKTEVTQAEWTAVMGRNPSSYKADGKPVEMVNWEEATEFCRRLTDRERSRGTLPQGWIYDLPTEAQWEYACRAGAQSAWSFGDDPADLHKFGNYNDKTGNFAGNDTEHDDKQQYTAPVKTYLANPWGFYDMHGNVWEWCRDWYEQNLGSQQVSDPTGPPSGSFRVLRGGGFNFSAAGCRSANRHGYAPEYRYNDLGFRVAAVPDPSSPGVR